MMPTSLLSNMNKNYDFTVKLKANDTGSAVLVKHNECYYLLTAAHVCDKHPGEKPLLLQILMAKRMKSSLQKWQFRQPRNLTFV